MQSETSRHTSYFLEHWYPLDHHGDLDDRLGDATVGGTDHNTNITTLVHVNIVMMPDQYRILVIPGREFRKDEM